jgi:hypothetical protein
MTLHNSSSLLKLKNSTKPENNPLIELPSSGNIMTKNLLAVAIVAAAAAALSLLALAHAQEKPHNRLIP